MDENSRIDLDINLKSTNAGGATLAADSSRLGPDGIAARPPADGAGDAKSGEPPKWKKLLSLPDHDVHTLIDVKVSMRDGVKLSANIFLPDKPGRWPVILERTPYGGKAVDWYINRALYYAKRGYAYVLQDVRGRYDSDGVWFAHNYTEIDDGRDSVDWCGTQTWSDGNVGMIGMSDMGFLQWLTAPTGSPYLRTIIPQMSPADEYLYGMNYTGGAFLLYINLPWAMGNYARSRQSPIPYNWDRLYQHLPILTADEAATGQAIDFYRGWVLHSRHDESWKKISNFGKFQKMDIPILQIAGWLDAHAKSAFANYEGIQREGTPLARQNFKMVVGPWIHKDLLEPKYGVLEFGKESVIDLYELFLRWLDHWLKKIDNEVEKEPPLKLFAMGINKWKEAEKWPLPTTRWDLLYLRSGGRANSLFGDGSLSRDKPAAGEPPDTFVYDPKDPVPALGLDPNGQIFPMDQRPVERRKDVLVYSTSPLQEDLEVTGPVQAIIFASSSAADTDWTVKLLDVYPEQGELGGTAVNLCDGVLRARFRQPAAIRSGVPAPGQFEHPELMEPNKVYAFKIEVGVIGIVFRKGHSIRIEVSSSNFPRFDRNLNNGGELGIDPKIIVAHQTIHHNSEYPSHIELPVIPI